MLMRGPLSHAAPSADAAHLAHTAATASHPRAPDPRARRPKRGETGEAKATAKLAVGGDSGKVECTGALTSTVRT
jgi:hypothetical protein